MPDLRTYLLERVAEDKQAARLIHDRSCAALDDWCYRHNHSDEPNPYPCDCDLPARVLAECEAKRLIVTLHADHGYREVGTACDTCGTPHEYPVRWPCDTLRALALPYVDREDFAPEWNEVVHPEKKAG